MRLTNCRISAQEGSHASTGEMKL